MKVYLTSFWDRDIINNPKIQKYSIARWQPKRFNFKELNFFKPILAGYPITKVAPEYYIHLYAQALRRNYGKISDWFFKQKKDTALLCWCNNRRQERFENVMCHTIIAGWVLEDLNNDLSNEFIYGDGRKADWFDGIHRDDTWELIADVLETK